MAHGGGCRGWADRLAGHLAGNGRAALRQPGHARQAAGEVVDEQVPAAVEMGPELVTIAAGGNDLLRAGADPDLLAVVFNQAVDSCARLAAGC